MTATAGLAGTRGLLRLALRRDRVLIPAWVLGLTALVASGAAAFGQYYADPSSRASLAADLAGNASLRALYGRLYSTGIGGLTAWRMGAFGAALAGLMGLLITVRHTREEEEAGRLELLGAARVGRRAPLTAALLTAWGASLALGLLTALSMLHWGVAGAAALGLAFTAAGCCFAAVAAVTAQLVATARAARGLAGAALGAAFLLRAAGDAAGRGGPSWLAWCSPLGWVERGQAYGAERWWPPALALAAAALLAVLGHGLAARRDLDAALLPQRPGPESAGRGLHGAFGLAWRLQRGPLAGWAAGYAVAGLVLGALTKGVVDLVAGNRQLADALRRLGGAAGVADAYLASMVSMLGMVAAVYAVQSVLRLRGEEAAGRAEPVLATATGRLRWAASHLAVAAGGAVLLMLTAGLALAAGRGAAGGGWGRLPGLLGASLAQLPAVLLLGACALLLYGAAPRAAAAGWGVVSLTLAIGLYGPVLRLDRWVLDLSAFTHIPRLPGARLDAAPLVWLLLLTAGLATAGLAALRRRDLG